MKAGREIKTLVARDGRKVILRTPKWEDLGDLLELINSLVEEKADIVRTEKVSRQEEIDWLAGALARLEKEEIFLSVAEVGRKVVASSEVRREGGASKHVGDVGIVIREGYRDIGIGTELMKALIDQAKQMGIEGFDVESFCV